MANLAKVVGTGVFLKGRDVNKPFIRVSINGKSYNWSATVNMVREAERLGVVCVKVIGLKELYPTSGGDSSSVYPEGHAKAGLPIYVKDEKLTVEDYFTRKGTEKRVLYNFGGFPLPATIAELAKKEAEESVMM